MNIVRELGWGQLNSDCYSFYIEGFDKDIEVIIRGCKDNKEAKKKFIELIKEIKKGALK